MSSREHFFDGLRGLSIVSVIGIHAAVASRDFYSPGIWPPNFTFLVYWTQLLLWAVPTFFFISGYWAARSLISSPVSYTNFITKRLSRVAVPYVIWSVFFTLYFTRTLDVGQIARNLALGTAVGPYYFVISLIALMIITPLLVRATRNNAAFAAGVAVVAACHLLLSYWAHITYPNANWWYFMFPPTAWIAFYGYGLLEARRELDGHVRQRSTVLGILAVAFFVVASFSEARFLTNALGYNGGGMIPIKISSFGLSFSVIYLSLSLRDSIFWNRFSWLGLLSFGIYFIHEPIRGRLISFFSRFRELSEVQPLFQLIVISVTLLISAGIVFCVRRLFPKWSVWIGFR